ncbi:hypothetical protein [Nocardia brasiliensis]|uniref:hypothetical protein n=1 Tax=Nocardia brasiliensis TaxID=37326 RepID=UPI00245669E9|nr:hypothetical protein [Nocardia brasiliensis]
MSKRNTSTIRRILGLTGFAAVLITSATSTVNATPTQQYPLDARLGTLWSSQPEPSRDKRDPDPALPYIDVPADYVYNPTLEPVARHDYCTSSFDQFGSANFEGPCARHDMCYDVVDQKRAEGWRDVGYGPCNAAFYHELRINCMNAYPDIQSNAFALCHNAAAVYAYMTEATHWGQN